MGTWWHSARFPRRGPVQNSAGEVRSPGRFSATTSSTRKGIPMSQTIEGRAEELLKAKNFCIVSTVRPDGAAHAAPTWIGVQDGRPVLNTAEGRTWPENL